MVAGVDDGGAASLAHEDDAAVGVAVAIGRELPVVGNLSTALDAVGGLSDAAVVGALKLVVEIGLGRSEHLEGEAHGSGAIFVGHLPNLGDGSHASFIGSFGDGDDISAALRFPQHDGGHGGESCG